MKASVILHLPALLVARREAERELRALCLQKGYAPALVGELLSAFIEAFNNVVIHAYKDQEGGQVDVMLELSDDRAIIEVSDRGRNFDISSVPPAPHPDQPQEGGYGLHIIRSLMSHVSYYQDGTRNVLRMIKQFDQVDKQS